MSADYWKSTQRTRWKFTKEELAEKRQKISRIDGSLGLEDPCNSWDGHVRLYIFNLVQYLGQRLRTRQRVICTAQVYLLRWFTRVSLNEVNIFLLVATSLYVASKAEELPLHIRSVGSEARGLWHDYMPQDATNIAECEFYMLDELESCLVVFHPYRSLDVVVESVADMQPLLALSPEEMQGVWGMINSSYASDIPLLYSPTVIALACLYMTLVLRPQLAKLSRQPEKVKARIDLLASYLGKSAVDLEKIAECVQELVSLYARWETYDQRQIHSRIIKSLSS